MFEKDLVKRIYLHEVCVSVCYWKSTSEILSNQLSYVSNQLKGVKKVLEWLELTIKFCLTSVSMLIKCRMENLAHTPPSLLFHVLILPPPLFASHLLFPSELPPNLFVFELV